MTSPLCDHCPVPHWSHTWVSTLHNDVNFVLDHEVEEVKGSGLEVLLEKDYLKTAKHAVNQNMVLASINLTWPTKLKNKKKDGKTTKQMGLKLNPF